MGKGREGSTHCSALHVPKRNSAQAPDPTPSVPRERPCTPFLQFNHWQFNSVQRIECEEALARFLFSGKDRIHIILLKLPGCVWWRFEYKQLSQHVIVCCVSDIEPRAAYCMCSTTVERLSVIWYNHNSQRHSFVYIKPSVAFWDLLIVINTRPIVQPECLRCEIEEKFQSIVVWKSCLDCPPTATATSLRIIGNVEV